MLKASGRLDLHGEGGRLSLDGVEIQFSESHGHTPGMLVSWIGIGHETFIFTGDLIPGHAWINLPITMGFDRFPELLVEEKNSFWKWPWRSGPPSSFPMTRSGMLPALGMMPKKAGFWPLIRSAPFPLPDHNLPFINRVA